ncbi:alpha/beta hydrolase [Brevundimonas sp. EAKA]|jgi:acetyl esterase/lipase|uniref:Carboxylesterase NlhH n=1 Tax=Brevundimonas mediterranea TaxID=74329 RepID=A0A7Z8Y6U2_9CAUL|nr:MULTISPECIES: alpha/beta hydrolase [Brevundimonas]KDP93541.1 alpha/beta hydrolase [Brevundimonas sp. EAKA]VDC52027.1 Carboxylesterase NlhH [Brevundimonas mediterranea]
MTRRGLLAPIAGLMAAACSPLGLLNSLGPRDGGVRRVARDIAYGDDPRQRLDLYAPTAPGTYPVLVFFYGGGWDSGSRDLYGWAAQALAAQGFVVALPDYRVVPQVVFPAFIEDAAVATAKAADVAAAYGGDPERLGVLGHSAGAHLALMISLDRRYMQAVDRPGLIRAAAGLAGPYDFLPFDVGASRNAFGRAPDPTLTQPVTFVRPDAPPIWLGHGTADVVVHAEDTTILDQRMKAVGGRSEAKLYPGLDHADLIATFSPLFRKKATILADVSGFFHRELG